MSPVMTVNFLLRSCGVGCLLRILFKFATARFPFSSAGDLNHV